MLRVEWCVYELHWRWGSIPEPTLPACYNRQLLPIYCVIFFFINSFWGVIPTSESALPTLERYSYKAWFLLEVFVCAEWITCLCLVSAIKLGWVLGSFPETCSFLACLCVVSVCLVCVWSEPSSLAEFWGLSPRLAPSWRVCVWWVYDLFVLGQYPKACWVLRSFPETCSSLICLCVVSVWLVCVWSVP